MPLASAVKVGGERLYRKAGAVRSSKRPSATCTSSGSSSLRFDEEQQAGELELECSSGTYVRQLVTDLGEHLRCGRALRELERTAIGPFRLDRPTRSRSFRWKARSGSCRSGGWTPRRHAVRGTEMPWRPGAGSGAGQGPIRLTADGELVAVAEPRDGALKPVTVLSA